MTRKYIPAVERFWSKVEKTNTCWLWTGSTGAAGYGGFRPDSQTDGRRWVRAHRWYWEQENGPIPDGLVLHHTCHNRNCVLLEHLELTTQVKNLEESTKENRLASYNWYTGIRSCHLGVYDG